LVTILASDHVSPTTVPGLPDSTGAKAIAKALAVKYFSGSPPHYELAHCQRIDLQLPNVRAIQAGLSYRQASDGYGTNCQRSDRKGTECKCSHRQRTRGHGTAFETPA
jgi:hypothetical protein